MSVTVSNADGVTVLTVVSDPNGRLPPLCQILKAICQNLPACSVPPHLKQVQRASLLVLGTLHIIIGLLSLSLGIILHFSNSCRDQYPYWSGILFVISGIICILCEKKPCPCLILPNMFLNFVGVFGAIGAIFIYSISMTAPHSACGNVSGSFGNDDDEQTITILSIGINGVLMSLSALEFCVAFAALVSALKVLRSFNRNQNLSSSEPEQMTNLESTEVPYEICIISTSS